MNTYKSDSIIRTPLFFVNLNNSNSIWFFICLLLEQKFSSFILYLIIKTKRVVSWCGRRSFLLHKATFLALTKLIKRNIALRQSVGYFCSTRAKYTGVRIVGLYLYPTFKTRCFCRLRACKPQLNATQNVYVKLSMWYICYRSELMAHICNQDCEFGQY